MSEEEELQNEEKEVLISIYEGDESFKQVNPTTYQYKYVENESKSFIVEILWGPKYPNEKPNINLDIFYNQSLSQSIKDNIKSVLTEEAEQWLGSGMTYTLFECLKDKVTELLEGHSEEIVERIEKIAVEDDQQDEPKKAEKKEQLTKSQKRKAWDRAEVGKGGEKPRGWDWVDIVKHLSHVPHTPSS